MKALLVKYKSVITFILTFLLVYITLSMLYKFYLQYSVGGKFYPDYVTNVVAKQTQFVLNELGYDAQVMPHQDEPSMKLIVNGKYLARVIEGCNSISVVILFISFIISFSGNVRDTLVFLVLGSVLVYAVNLFRIVILSIGMYHYPWRREVLHTVVFPTIIYGMVFLLWIFWVNRFSKLKKKDD